MGREEKWGRKVVGEELSSLQSMKTDPAHVLLAHGLLKLGIWHLGPVQTTPPVLQKWDGMCLRERSPEEWALVFCNNEKIGVFRKLW